MAKFTVPLTVYRGVKPFVYEAKSRREALEKHFETCVTHTMLDFTDANFTGLNLRCHTFTACDLAYANFNSCSSHGMLFQGCDLSHTRWKDVELEYVYFSTSALVNANFKGALFMGRRVRELARQATRSDGHEFFLWRLADNQWIVRAGCRRFTMDEAWQHWEKTRANTPLGDESLDILTMFELYIQRTEKR